MKCSCFPRVFICFVKRFGVKVCTVIRMWWSPPAVAPDGGVNWAVVFLTCSLVACVSFGWLPACNSYICFYNYAVSEKTCGFGQLTGAFLFLLISHSERKQILGDLTHFTSLRMIVAPDLLFITSRLRSGVRGIFHTSRVWHHGGFIQDLILVIQLKGLDYEWTGVLCSPCWVWSKVLETPAARPPNESAGKRELGVSKWLVSLLKAALRNYPMGTFWSSASPTSRHCHRNRTVTRCLCFLLSLLYLNRLLITRCRSTFYSLFYLLWKGDGKLHTKQIS